MREPAVVALAAVAVNAQAFSPNEINNLARDSKVTQNTVIAVHLAPIPGYLIAVRVLFASGAYPANVRQEADRG